MNEITVLRYKGTETSREFGQVLSHRVDQYFIERGISKHANTHMILKGVLWFSLWIGTYLLLISGWFSPLGLVAMFVVHGFAQLFMTYNIAHDANHGAYSSDPKVNRFLSCVFDLVGISSYIWRLLHNTSHHSFVNVEGKDRAIKSSSLLRFSPEEQWSRNHRYQHIYGPVLYLLPTLYWVLVKDFYHLFCGRKYGNRLVTNHPLNEYVFLFVTKAFYFTYMLVIPIMVLSVAWYWIVLGFLAMHACIGFHIALIFQPTHITEGTEYPHPDEEGFLTKDFILHVLSTTADYSRKKPFTTWMLGGLNLHIIHHMFPTICHVHYRPLTEIIKETAEEFGYRYRENETVFVAFLAHLRMLKSLGQPTQSKQQSA